MLTEFEGVVAWSGNFDHLGLQPHWYVTFFAFISNELPKWRDDPKRPTSDSETVLTSQLCAYLNSVSRKTRGWDFLQFRVEEPDETVSGRKIDLIPAPAGITIWIEGRQYSQYDSLIPIECKRLPTPTTTQRDEREYLFSKVSTTGGVQRFKEGNHGSSHLLGAMIGYIQKCDISFWEKRVAEWIKELLAERISGWKLSDSLTTLNKNPKAGVALLESSHDRVGELSPIQLHHLWVDMRSGVIPIG